MSEQNAEYVSTTELSTYVVAGTEDERMLAMEVIWWRNRFPATATERAQIDSSPS